MNCDSGSHDSHAAEYDSHDSCDDDAGPTDSVWGCCHSIHRNKQIMIIWEATIPSI